MLKFGERQVSVLENLPDAISACGATFSDLLTNSSFAALFAIKLVSTFTREFVLLNAALAVPTLVQVAFVQMTEAMQILRRLGKRDAGGAGAAASAAAAARCFQTEWRRRRRPPLWLATTQRSATQRQVPHPRPQRRAPKKKYISRASIKNYPNTGKHQYSFTVPLRCPRRHWHARRNVVTDNERAQKDRDSFLHITFF